MCRILRNMEVIEANKTLSAHWKLSAQGVLQWLETCYLLYWDFFQVLLSCFPFGQAFRVIINVSSEWYGYAYLMHNHCIGMTVAKYQLHNAYTVQQSYCKVSVPKDRNEQFQGLVALYWTYMNGQWRPRDLSILLSYRHVDGLVPTLHEQ